MPVETANTAKPSFSSARRIGIWLNVLLSVVAVLALLVMGNYLAAGYYKRISVRADSRFDLAPQTLKALQSVTNDVNVTIFFDVHGDQSEVYELTSALLKEYHNVNPHIKIKTLDFTRFPGDAAVFLSKYKITGLRDKNFVFFDCNGQTKAVYATELSDYDIRSVLAGQTKEFRRTAFRGEMLFSSAIFAVTHPRPLKAYFLAGHGEHDPEDLAENGPGYGKFAALLKDEHNVDWTRFVLRGTNEVPADCELLIVAGPAKSQLAQNEIEVISNYLNKGGRMLVLLNSLYVGGASGIEKVLARWGVDVGNNIVTDPENVATRNDLLTWQMNPNHDVTKAMFKEGLRVQLVLPRSVEKAAEVPKTAEVKVLAATGTNAIAKIPNAKGVTERAESGTYGLMVAVEQGAVKGASAGTRLLVVGDSLCFDNQLLDSAANHYFAGFAVNWLLAQPNILLEGLGARPVKTYKLNITESELNKVRLLFVGGIPGGILLLGGLVWLRRRS